MELHLVKFMESNYEECLEVLKDLERKAGYERENYSALASKNKKRINLFSTIVIISSITVTFLSIADPELIGLENKDSVFIYLTLLGIVLTLATIADKLLNLNEKHASYRTSISVLTEYIRDIHKYINTEMKNQTSEDRTNHTEALKNSYTKIIGSLLQIDMNSNKFFKLKQIRALKIQASEKIDKDPMADISSEIKMIKKLQRRR